MGFLSRKTKSKSAVIDEPHPILEELERMEEAVPERSGRPSRGALSAGPGARSAQAAGEAPISTPPAAEGIEASARERSSGALAAVAAEAAGRRGARPVHAR